MIESRTKHPATRCGDASIADRATLAGLRAALGPDSYYWRVNTAEDTWSDWLEYRRMEPAGTLRGYARLLLHHEARRWGTAPWPLIRRLATFLRRQGEGGRS